MDATRFDHLMRALTLTPTRRDVARALTGLALGGALAPARSDDAGAKNKRKKCGPCQARRKGKCKGNKPDDTTCRGDGKCFAGKCIPRPTCVGSGNDCGLPEQCCSGFCVAGAQCFPGGIDQPCYGQSDCSNVPVALRCVAYRCR